MNQRRWLQGVLLAFAGHGSARQPSQLLIHETQQRIFRKRVALTPGLQQMRNVGLVVFSSHEPIVACTCCAPRARNRCSLLRAADLSKPQHPRHRGVRQLLLDIRQRAAALLGGLETVVCSVDHVESGRVDLVDRLL